MISWRDVLAGEIYAVRSIGLATTFSLAVAGFCVDPTPGGLVHVVRGLMSLAEMLA